MIQKLRMKFIGIFIGSLAAVIVVLMGLLNIFYYQSMVQSADGLLKLLAENDGSFPPPEEREETPKEKPEEKPRGGFRYWKLSPETPYETRFFLVRFGEEGEFLSADTGKIASVDEETAQAYAEKVKAESGNCGFLGQYRYRKEITENGMLILFLDCRRMIGTCRSVFLTSVGVSCFGILLVFGLIFILSGRVMKPVYESYEKQKRFITDAGHEIKTPLTIISADIDVLQMEIGENEWLEDMEKQVQRMTVLTNDLIYLARMQESGRQGPLIELPYSDLVEETAQSFQSVAIIENKKFTMNIQPMLMIKGEEKALRKLVAILLDNAVKYSGENGSIWISLEKSGRMARLTVENTAVGISREETSHFFERFYRADQSRNSQKGGYGIGLSIAEAIVKAHKGEIRASVREGTLLRITVSIPFQSSI